VVFVDQARKRKQKVKFLGKKQIEKENKLECHVAMIQSFF
jgi:hypothetical protein